MAVRGTQTRSLSGKILLMEVVKLLTKILLLRLLTKSQLSVNGILMKLVQLMHKLLESATIAGTSDAKREC